MAARLLVSTGKLRGKIFSLPPEGKVVIGRSQNATLPLPDVNLSRSHCSVAATPQGYVVSDLNSTNGTFLNGKKIAQVLLRENDRISIGESELEFRVRERFEDNETKMDLLPVGKLQEITPEEALQMMRATVMERSESDAQRPAPGPGAVEVGAAPPGILQRVRFCDICDANVPRTDRDSGAAREIEHRLLCAECIARLQGKNVDAAASLAHVLDELRAESQRAFE